MDRPLQQLIQVFRSVNSGYNIRFKEEACLSFKHVVNLFRVASEPTVFARRIISDIFD